MESITQVTKRTTTTTKTSAGIFPVPVKLTDAITFDTILARCIKLEVQRRMSEGKDPRTDAELKAIEEFSNRATKLAWKEAKEAFK